MKKRTTSRRRVHHTTRTRHKKLHHRVISFFRGDGGIYVIFILAAVMAGAFALTGGVIPSLNPKPSAADQVTIDTNSANSSSQSALQLVDIKIKPSDTPTPVPSNTPTPNPTLTPTQGVTPPPPPDQCLDKTVITLLLDVSTSMNSNDKIGKLNAAMTNFVSKLHDDTIVGAVQFAGVASFPPPDNGVVTLLPYTKYKDNKAKVRSTLENLTIHTNSDTDGTYMKNAVVKAISNINGEVSKYQGYKQISILFTDGVPETQFASDSPCEVEFNNPYLCFAQKQDPRGDGSNTDYALRLRNTVDKSYTVGIYTGARELQAYSQATQLLSYLASKPTYARSSKSTSALNQMFLDSINSVCN